MPLKLSPEINSNNNTDVKNVAVFKPGSSALNIDVVCLDKSRATKPSEPDDLLKLAECVKESDKYVTSNANNQLRQIVDQMRFLKSQAARILYQSKRDMDLNHAACNMIKKPGTTYHLYSRSDDTKVISLISPEEWGASCPNVYLGSYKLMHDMSWAAENEIAKRQEDDKIIEIISKTPQNVMLGFSDIEPKSPDDRNLSLSSS